MATVDDRVVKLAFDNKQFESASAATMATLEKLKQSLDFSSSRKGVDDLNGSFSRFNMGNMGTTIEGINGKFLAMATIAVTALSTITSKAIAVGTQMVKSLSTDQIVQGFKNYETQINAVQTIMANTGLTGQKGLGVVEKTLADLNQYANLTIYDFSQMTENIGRFTAAGVAIKPATDAIKGMSNVAALTGANTQQLGSAMYQMSQALSTGVIRLMDWNSLANANMGTQNMQMALKATAHTLGDHGKAMDAAIKKNGSFRDSLQEGWLTSEIFTKTMGVMAGTLDKTTGRYRAFTIAELKAKGYTEAQAASLQKLSQAAIDSAINIRTYSQMIEALKEGVATAWGAIFKTLFGNIFDATKLFTGMYNALYDIFTKPLYDLNKFLGVFVKLGGVRAVISTVVNAFEALKSVIDPVKAAFRQIFPPATAQELYDLVVGLRDFFDGLRLSESTMAKVQRVFAGFFAVFDIAKNVLAGVIGVVVDLVKSFGGVGSGFLDAAANVGDFLVKVDNLVKNGALIPFFSKLNSIMVPVNKIIRAIGDALQKVFAGKSDLINSTADAIGRIGDRLSPFGSLLSTLNAAWQRFLGVLQTLSPFFSKLLQSFSDAFGKIPQIIQQSVQSGDYSAMLDTINTAIFGGIALMIHKFIKGGAGNLGGGLMSSIAGSFNELTNTLKAMQQQIKAKALVEIAIAVGILVASLVALSLIPSGKLTTALAAMAGVFTELMLAMKVLDKISASAGFIKLPLIAGALILLSTAILILSAALKVFASMSWEEIGKGLTALTVVLGELDVATKPLAANSLGLLAASAGLVLLGTALVIIGGAMKIFASMSWEEIAKGLGTTIGLLGGVALAMNFMPGPMMILTAAGLVLVAGAISVLAGAMAIFGTLSWESIAKGLVGVGVSLLIIAGAMALMPGPMLIATGAGLVLVAFALNGIAAAMKIMGSMSWEEIGKGLVALAGSLVVLAGGLYLMTGTIGGSLALIVAAGALMILAPAMKILGSLGWDQIGKGLLTLAGAFAVIGIAGLLLTPVIPQIIALGAAVALLGLGVALLGAGVFLFATAITMLVAAGSLGVVALTAILQTIIGVIPTVMVALQLAIIAFADAIIAATPKIIEAIVVVLTALMGAVIKLTPKVVKTLSVLLDAIIQLAIKYVPRLADAGMVIVTGILDGMSKRLPKMMDKAGDLIVAFITGLGKQSLKIVTAAGNTILTFLEGITTWINNNQSRIDSVTRNLVKAIVEGLVRGVVSLGGGFIDAIGGLAGSAIDKARELLHINSPSKDFIKIGKSIIEGWTMGVVNNTPTGVKAVTKATMSMADAFKTAIQDVNDSIPDNMDLTPTITPVIDLTQVRKDAKDIAGVINPAALEPTTTSQNLRLVSSALEASKATTKAPGATTEPQKIEFNQTNVSPKALTSIEIYRQTKNQLSTAKGVLSANTG